MVHDKGFVFDDPREVLRDVGILNEVTIQGDTIWLWLDGVSHQVKDVCHASPFLVLAIGAAGEPRDRGQVYLATGLSAPTGG